MRRWKRLHPAICDPDNVYAAYLDARRTHRHTDAHLRFADRLGENVAMVARKLEAGTWRTGHYRTFVVHEPKRRQVACLPFSDRVAHHAICRVIEPRYDATFIHDSYACRRGRGIHLAVHRTQHHLRSAVAEHGPVWALKGDIRRYFASIDHQVLRDLLARRIGCIPTLGLLAEIIGSTPGPVGIPIGNLTSQLFANIYLHELDVHVTRDLGWRRYGRYMDDWVVFGGDLDELHELQDYLERWLADRLHLTINPSTRVHRVTDAPGDRVNFCGYTVGPTTRKVRRSTIRRMRRGMAAARRGTLRADYEQFAASYRGLLAHEQPLRPALRAHLMEEAHR